MSLDLDKFLDLDLSYPGIDFGFESWAVRSYLEAIELSISHAQDQYRIKAEKELESKRADLLPEQFNQEWWQIDEIVDTQIPRHFRSLPVISLWAVFESFVSDIASYTARREGIKLSLRDVRAGNFRKQVEKYFEDMLQITLPWTANERLELARLHTLRHFIAHRNGRVSDLNVERRSQIEELVKETDGIKIEGGALMISADYVAKATSLVFSMVGALSQMIADRYDGPTVKSKKK